MKRLYSKNTLINAKNLRTTQTEFENILWQRIRAKRLNGVKFRRQVPIGNYIADFVNLETKLIIELDGSQHLNEQSTIYDNNRTKILQEKGYTLLRIYNSEITNDIDTVLNYIMNEYNKLI
ncbi:MAG: DUF559 domain-containing protein [Muribaculaceae bacterium]|nr:DUF559 domain-containing protein [Muribaculaceae bacterium]